MDKLKGIAVTSAKAFAIYFLILVILPVVAAMGLGAGTGELLGRIYVEAGAGKPPTAWDSERYLKPPQPSELDAIMFFTALALGLGIFTGVVGHLVRKHPRAAENIQP